jgi:phosphate acyltransferase
MSSLLRLKQQELNNISIAIDAMGGDKAPKITIRGANLAAKYTKGKVKFLLFGDEAKLKPLLEKCNYLKDCHELIHTPDKITSDDKPSAAMRNRNSSMALAINAVKDKAAIAAISAGNTGALMAISTLALRTLEGISRPALGSVLPSQLKPVVMLDLGANLNSTAQNLYEFAVMGDAFAKVLLGYPKPTIGLLNIGTEEIKGGDEIKAAAELIKANPHLTYKQFVEGNQISQGIVDVVVADGFSGNVALKTAEGTAKLISGFIRKEFKRSFFMKIAALLAYNSMRRLKRKMDPRYYNGAMMLGLNGIVVKSHGGTDKVGFAHAVATAILLANRDINSAIKQELVK